MIIPSTAFTIKVCGGTSKQMAICNQIFRLIKQLPMNRQLSMDKYYKQYCPTVECLEFLIHLYNLIEQDAAWTLQVNSSRHQISRILGNTMIFAHSTGNKSLYTKAVFYQKQIHKTDTDIENFRHKYYLEYKCKI
jgi:hypothetical protein